ncbi:MAG TPA: putative ABC transporter permease [Candidatus Baltobacteraceae bacterium]|nr:putative ABC transporter permease [Candidatus Baltobacteraceae bacterium]
MSTEEVVIYFCVYSVFGWAIDTAYRSFDARRYKAGGFSKLPFSPIYGFAALGIIALAPYVRPWPIPVEWAFFTVVLAAFEYVGGVASHRFFKRRLWDYSKDKWDLNGYTGPGYAAAWGFLALFVIYVMQPFLERTAASLR